MQLVILAAGMGSRFGGLKQMEPMDEAGNLIQLFSSLKKTFMKLLEIRLVKEFLN